jgi:hypothetical protein
MFYSVRKSAKSSTAKEGDQPSKVYQTSDGMMRSTFFLSVLVIFLTFYILYLKFVDPVTYSFVADLNRNQETLVTLSGLITRV